MVSSGSTKVKYNYFSEVICSSSSVLSFFLSVPSSLNGVPSSSSSRSDRGMIFRGIEESLRVMIVAASTQTKTPFHVLPFQKNHRIMSAISLCILCFVQANPDTSKVGQILRPNAVVVQVSRMPQHPSLCGKAFQARTALALPQPIFLNPPPAPPPPLIAS